MVSGQVGYVKMPNKVVLQFRVVDSVSVVTLTETSSQSFLS